VNPSPDNRHKWALPYWARPGIMTAKAADDDGGGDDDKDDDKDDDDDDDDDDDLSGLTVEQLRAELKKSQAGLKTANDRSARRRTLLKTERETRAELEQRIKSAPTPKGKTDDDDEPKVDVKAAVREAEERVQSAADERVKLSELRGALRSLIPEAKLDRALKLVDLGDLSINRKGDVDGVDEAIDELKADMPELFAKPTRRRRSISGQDDDDDAGSRRSSSRPNAPKGQSVSERQAAQLLGR
jgi:hypothetical protein